MRSLRGLKPVGTYVDAFARGVYQRRGFMNPQMICDWPRITSPEFAKIMTPIKITFPSRARRDGTLHVAVQAAHAVYIPYIQQQIIERVNQYFGYSAVAKMHMKQVSAQKS